MSELHRAQPGPNPTANTLAQLPARPDFERTVAGILGFPHSGKSIFSGLLLQAQWHCDPFHPHRIRAAPDGQMQGIVQEMTEKNFPLIAEALANAYKHRHTPEYIDYTCRTVENASNPLTTVDISGVIDRGNLERAARCTDFLLVVRNKEEEMQWRAFVSQAEELRKEIGLGSRPLKVWAVVTSDYHGENSDAALQMDDTGSYRATLHCLQAGLKPHDRPVVIEIVERLLQKAGAEPIPFPTTGDALSVLNEPRYLVSYETSTAELPILRTGFNRRQPIENMKSEDVLRDGIAQLALLDSELPTSGAILIDGAISQTLAAGIPARLAMRGVDVIAMRQRNEGNFLVVFAKEDPDQVYRVGDTINRKGDILKRVNVSSSITNLFKASLAPNNSMHLRLDIQGDIDTPSFASEAAKVVRSWWREHGTAERGNVLYISGRVPNTLMANFSSQLMDIFGEVAIQVPQAGNLYLSCLKQQVFLSDPAIAEFDIRPVLSRTCLDSAELKPGLHISIVPSANRTDAAWQVAHSTELLSYALYEPIEEVHFNGPVPVTVTAALASKLAPMVGGLSQFVPQSGGNYLRVGPGPKAVGDKVQLIFPTVKPLDGETIVRSALQIPADTPLPPDIVNFDIPILENLSILSRTTAGVFDRSTSSQKPYTALAGETLAHTARLNLSLALHKLSSLNLETFESPESLRKSIFEIWHLTQRGIIVGIDPQTPPPLRSWPVIPKIAIAPERIPEAINSWLSEYTVGLPNVSDPVTFAGRMLHQLCFVIRPFVEGNMRISIIMSALPHILHQRPLPVFDIREEFCLFGEKGENEFLAYYKSKIRNIENTLN